ncbi:MAG: sigma-54-dependent transcriptional regulator [Candidatus Rifleibacteriota bacterium]
MKILLVDDNASLVRGLKIFLEQQKHECFTAGTVAAGCRILDEQNFDLVITDLKLPDGQGLEIAAKARNNNLVPAPEVILMTAFGSVETAVKAMKLGAVDYLTKPVSMEEFAFRIDRINNFRDIEIKNQSLKEQQHKLLDEMGMSGELDQIAGSSWQNKEVKQLIIKVAPYPSTVLITGETGVGKELVARAVHRLSSRCEQPFVKVNCASIPSTLFESELFGYEKGAFTGADKAKPGCFEAADGGTVFLDEIGEIPIELQAKLLRVLQEKEITRIGTTRPRAVNVRIVAATNRNLNKMVEEQLFREDLFYRLSVVKIPVPPLRERIEDIGEICSHLLKRISADLQKVDLKLDRKCLARLKQLYWPGNIRELRNSLERAAVMAEDNVLDAAHFNLAEENYLDEKSEENAGELAALEGSGLIARLEALEKNLIIRALQNNNNVKSRAAEELKIPRTQLIYRMKRLGL